MNKVALVTGITGQDGSYLAELLIEKGYKVVGLKRRSSSPNTDRIDHLLDDRSHNNSLETVYSDLTDGSSLDRIIAKYRPDEIYNLAAQSHVQVSFEKPVYTAQASGLGTLHLLEAVRNAGLTSSTRFYQASTSELFGKVAETPQRETTPFHPRSPYAVAKLYSYWITINYRESYDMFACNGILFNHESPRRGLEFVTRKITRSVAAIKAGRQNKLYLGNLDARRDWGHAKDYVRGMWQMLQQDKAEDFVLASGSTVTVREFVELAFEEVGIKLDWQGNGANEKGLCQETGRTLVEVSEEFFRPAEVDLLLGDASKARSILGWTPQITLREMVSEMVASDLRAFDQPRQI